MDAVAQIRPECIRWRDRRTIILFAGALIVRLAYLLTADGPAFLDPIVDADYYDSLGERIERGEGFEEGPFWQPPLYPLVLGGLYAGFGHHLLVPRLLQALLGALTTVLAARIAVRASGRVGVGLLAGALVALHGPLVFYDGEILPTSLATFLATLAVDLAGSLKPTLMAAAGCGAAVGLGTLAVGPVFPLIVPLAIWLGQGRWLRGVLALAAALLFPLAATVTNAVRSGEWILISANSGINLWIGNNPDTDQTVAVRPGAGWEELVEEPNQHGVVSPGDQNTYFTGKAVDFCLEKPLACLGNLLWKARLLLVARELPRNEDLYVVRGQSPVLWVLTARAGPVALPYVLIIPLGAAGAWWTFHRGKGSRKNRPDVPAAPREARLLVWSTLALALAPVVFFVTGRYRAPMAPLLSALAALGVYALWIGRRRAWKGMVTAELALLLSVWPVELPVDGIDFEAELHYAVGGRRARLGDDAGAVEALRRAVEKRPDYTEARFNLGLALERLGRWDDATEAYRGILLRSPDHEPSKTRLDVLHSLGH